MRGHFVDERHNDDDLRPAKTVLHVTQTIGRPEPIKKPAAPVSAPRRFGAAILKKILGGSVVASSTTIDDKIVALHAEIAAAEAQQRAVAEKLARPGLLTDAEHERLEAETAAAGRTIVRAKDVIRGLEAEREVLAAAEAKAAFLKHVEVARLRATAAAARLQVEYEPAAKIIASILADVRASQDEIVDLKRQGREFGEMIEIESALNVRGSADASASLAVLMQGSELLTDVSLPGLLYADPDIVPPCTALSRRLPRLPCPMAQPAGPKRKRPRTLLIRTRRRLLQVLVTFNTLAPFARRARRRSQSRLCAVR